MMTPDGGVRRSDGSGHGGDVYLTVVGAEHWESMLDTLDIAPDRWMDRPVLSGTHIRQYPDGSGSADVRLQLARPPQVIEVLRQQFPVGHIDHIDLHGPPDQADAC